ncbi:unnamed protein product [Paramecium sonneborni]|uniref:Uncharacterized protein n=1 Tax=Paramecium sonneborni TaxID=65129 RepID=A0A8S1M7D0_9CILI|nr:unnamed protein product [Paramecium sonneborni]
MLLEIFLVLLSNLNYKKSNSKQNFKYFITQFYYSPQQKIEKQINISENLKNNLVKQENELHFQIQKLSKKYQNLIQMQYLIKFRSVLLCQMNTLKNNLFIIKLISIHIKLIRKVKLDILEQHNRKRLTSEILYFIINNKNKTENQN